MSTLTELRQKFHSVWPLLDERNRRIMAANEAMSLGYGGVSLVRRASGLSRKAITKGIHEIKEGIAPSEGPSAAGARAQRLRVSDPRLLEALEEMIEGETRGDPESPLRSICKSTRAISGALCRQKTPSAMPQLRSFSMPLTTASRAIAKHWRGPIIPIGMRSSGTSMPS